MTATEQNKQLKELVKLLIFSIRAVGQDASTYRYAELEADRASNILKGMDK